MKRFWILTFGLFSVVAVSAQSVDDFQKRYEQFVRQSTAKYNSFRDDANKRYADFVRKSWEWFHAVEPERQPKEETKPPVVINEDEKRKPLDDTPIVIEEVIDVPAPEPQPEPVEPIESVPDVPTEQFQFTIYGSTFSVPLTPDMRFSIPQLTEEHVAQAWEHLSQPAYNNLINQCLTIRSEKSLCDWSYLRLLHKMCSDFLGADSNEAELLKAYVYCQSGYNMRLAVIDDRLGMLYASNHKIYNKTYWTIDNTVYYCDRTDNVQKAYICAAQFPQTKPLSLAVSENQKFEVKSTATRVIKSDDVEWLAVESSTNANLVEFCNDYPTSYIGDNQLTRWALYADMPLSLSAQQAIYPTLRKYIAGSTPAEAVNLLCHWVQTAFVYEYDDKVWGGDRAFFAEETLYYPYADCEDRSILLTRIVRDLLGLDCALVYYPGHLATAIAVGDDVKGDYFLIDNKRFIVCDPTFIGAPIGMTMTTVDKDKATAILLK